MTYSVNTFSLRQIRKMCFPDLRLILKLFTVTTFFIGSSWSETNACRQKHFENIMSGGSPLPTANIISSHNVPLMASCFMRCFQESRCVGFNYRWSGAGVNETNCQLSNNTKGRIGLRNEDGEWDFYQDIEMTNKTGRPDNEDGEQISTGQQHSNDTCTALRQKNSSLPSGSYFIYPGDVALPPFQVHCDMESKNGIGVIVIGHNSESRTKVDNYEDPGSYSRKIRYNTTMQQIVAVINQSKNCEQFIMYECSDSILFLNSVGYWISRQGRRMNYWGGAAVDSGKCACGMNNTCVGGGNCNCDANEESLWEDSGFLTDKNTLPVAELRFGDTGEDDEYGYHTLGKLLCWG